MMAFVAASPEEKAIPYEPFSTAAIARSKAPLAKTMKMKKIKRIKSLKYYSDFRFDCTRIL
jgi:hypothetical protein